MDDENTPSTSPSKREPWNKGKFTGAKPTCRAVASGRVHLARRATRKACLNFDAAIERAWSENRLHNRCLMLLSQLSQPAKRAVGTPKVCSPTQIPNLRPRNKSHQPNVYLLGRAMRW